MQHASTHALTHAARPAARLAWLGLFLVATTLVVVQVARHGPGALALAIALMVAPDLTMLLGAGHKGADKPLVRGQLAPTAVPFYNAAHRLWGPLVLLAAGILWPGSAVLVTAGLAWLAHVAIDRGVGFGLRTREGFQRGQAGR
jgi:Domain of unknown function (DUF4260)